MSKNLKKPKKIDPTLLTGVTIEATSVAMINHIEETISEISTASATKVTKAKKLRLGNTAKLIKNLGFTNTNSMKDRSMTMWWSRLILRFHLNQLKSSWSSRFRRKLMKEIWQTQIAKLQN